MEVSVEDGGELRRFISDVAAATRGALPKVDAVVKRGAHNVKEDLSEQAAESTHFSSKRGRGLETAMSYDSNYRPGVVQYEVGPDKARRGGALGNIFFFGGANGGGGTGDLDGALKREEPRMVKALGDLLGGLL